MKPLFLYALLCMLPAAVYSQSKAENNARIFPNPATNKFTYTFPAGIQKHLLQVTDMGGRTVYNQVVGDVGTQNSINISDWRTGIYFVSINSSTFSKTFRLIKQ